jgi:hypothetical protein
MLVERPTRSTPPCWLLGCSQSHFFRFGDRAMEVLPDPAPPSGYPKVGTGSRMLRRFTEARPRCGGLSPFSDGHKVL